MMTTKKYVARVNVSGRVIGERPAIYITVGVRMTSNKLLKDLLDRVAGGTTGAAEALEQLAEAFRAQPFEDLGFARVDHHRAIRQGFPEVILGLGKTPEQIAAIAKQIVSRGSTLLVTRASQAAFDAVRAAVPLATYHAAPGIITLR